MADFLEFWYAALHSDYGVVVDSHGQPEPVRQKLYAARRESGDPDLKALSICVSPINPVELWIVKREPSNGLASKGKGTSGSPQNAGES